MPRKLKLSKGRFMREYRKANTMMELAAALDVTVPTTYNYCQRYDVEAIKKTSDIGLSKTVFKAFQKSVTIEDLTQEFNLSRQMIRYHLNRGIYFYWVTEPTFEHLPKPIKLAHIKVAHLLMKKPQLENDPMQIAEITCNTFFVVEQYLSILFASSTKSTTKKKKKKKRVGK